MTAYETIERRVRAGHVRAVPDSPHQFAAPKNTIGSRFSINVRNPSPATGLIATLSHRKDTDQCSRDRQPVTVTTASKQSDRIPTSMVCVQWQILLVIGSHAMDHEKYAVLAQGGIAGVSDIFCIEWISDNHAIAERIRECRPDRLAQFLLTSRVPHPSVCHNLSLRRLDSEQTGHRRM